MDCVFCEIANGNLPSKVLYEDDLVMVIMDNSPLVDGHSLIIPKKHYEDYINLPDEVLIHIFKVAREMGPKLMKDLGCESVTLLANYGKDQAVKHFHLHLLPDLGTTRVSRAKRSIDENFNLIVND